MQFEFAGQCLFKCRIEGRPFIKKNTARHYGHKCIYSKQFLSWEYGAINTMALAHAGKVAIDAPVVAVFRFHLANRHAEPDVSNLVEGPQDALKKAGVITDDKLVHCLVASKTFGKDYAVEIELYPL